MITFIFVLIVLGVALWFIENYLPMAPPIKMLIRVVVVLVILWYLLSFLGLVSMPRGRNAI